MRTFSDRNRVRCIVGILLCAAVAMALCMPETVHAARLGKTVRVGWYESSFNTRDKAGRRSGYAYEYQLKIAAYTGWNYEYVNGSWSELLEMLKRGEIDLMSDVSYTEERSSQMLYPSLPMGTEEYYLFTTPENKDIDPEDYTTLNGKKVGVNKDSVQADFFRDWEKQQGVHTRLIELTCEENESLKMLEKGKLDAYITPDAFSNPEYLVPVCKVGSSDYYFAVSNDRKDLLKELDSAMSSIQDENRYFNQQMSEKYLLRSGVNAFLTATEDRWLKEHGPIRVGYQDDYMAFCAKDKETGKLTGALKNYLEYASDCLENAHIDFEAVAYPTSAATMDALNKGEVDCIFPVNLSGYDGETRDLVITPPMITADVVAVIREADKDTFADKKHVVVAVNEGNPNYDSFLKDYYPDWRTVYYPDTTKCLKAIADGVADCVLISSYRYNNIARECQKYDLTTHNTGVGVEYCFAVSNGEKEMYSILSRIVSIVPTSTINSHLSYYLTEDAKSTFKDFFGDHMDVFLIVAGYYFSRPLSAAEFESRIIHEDLREDKN